MLKNPKKLVCLTLAATLAMGTVTPAMSASAPTHVPPAAIVIDYAPTAATTLEQLEELSRSPMLPGQEAQETEGGLPLAIVLALAGSASAMGFYLYGGGIL